jgi:AcrR family transcriptional regulator
MRQGARRDALLDDADALLDEVGLDGLTITALAERSGVSRQLVYQHFPTVTELVGAMTVRRFEQLRAIFDQARIKGSPQEAARAQLRLVLTLEYGQRQFLREIFSRHSRSEDARRVAVIARERLIDRWAGVVDPENLSNPEVRSRIWAIFHALWGVWDMLDANEIDEKQAWTIMESFLRIPEP